MPKPAFTTWLADQSYRKDAVGVLAMDYEMNAEEAPRAITVAEVSQRPADVGAAPKYHAALDQAAEEYGRQAVQLAAPRADELPANLARYA